YEFTDLIAGTYIVTEEDKSAEGWRASNPENGKHENIEITSGSNVEVDFYNAPPATILLIKNNNATGSIGVGQTIEYTLTITVGQRTLSEMELIDVLPDGFIYQTNTSTVDGVPTEPVITNNGKTLTWNWNEEVPGESVITVKYTIQIDSANQAATYTNIAYVYGYGSPTLVESSIVDSSVIIEPQYKVEGKTAGGQVLGAATSEVLGAVLPAAGANTWYLLVALTLIGSGVILKTKNKKIEEN
ncbi:MAG: isopeptide-forming domain-containing fimbrial protein, partial [Candidatus Shapirobacteria bacterium]|nr:isopeptide-forming domain-containing fimbrial protein [Candidatus Shapirobacteria bacterium]